MFHPDWQGMSGPRTPEAAWQRLVARTCAAWMLLLFVVWCLFTVREGDSGTWNQIKYTVVLFAIFGWPLLLFFVLTLSVTAWLCRPRIGPDLRWVYVEPDRIGRTAWTVGAYLVALIVLLVAIVDLDILKALLRR